MKSGDSQVYEDLRNLHFKTENCKQQLKIINEGLGIDGSENSILKLMNLRSKDEPSDQSPGIVRSDIDELKTFTSEHHTSHKRLKKSFETFKKSYETEYTKVNRDLESYMERVMSKLSYLESRNQDFARELRQNKDFAEMEQNVKSIKDLLTKHNKTFDEILENLNLNQNFLY